MTTHPRSTLPEGWTMNVFRRISTVDVELQGPSVPDSVRPGKLFDAFASGPEYPPTDQGIAQGVVGALTAFYFHEFLETVTVNGVRAANPHPGTFPYGSAPMWDWLDAKVRDLITEYEKEFG